jgi:hypothetical protein
MTLLLSSIQLTYFNYEIDLSHPSHITSHHIVTGITTTAVYLELTKIQILVTVYTLYNSIRRISVKY